MDFFKTEDEETALTAADEAIYQHLGTFTQARFQPTKRPPARVCVGDVYVTESPQGHYVSRPDTLPLRASDLRDFIHRGLPSLKGFFSLIWNGVPQSREDLTYDDGFRSVVSYRTIEFMVRPLGEINADGPKRIHICPGDIQACLNLALNLAQNYNADEPMPAVVGTGSVIHPLDVTNQKKHPDCQPLRAPIPIEWKIDRTDEDVTFARVQKWRYDVCKGSVNYRRRLRQYSEYCDDHGIDNPRKDAPTSFPFPWERTRAENKSRRKPGSASESEASESEADQGASQLRPSWGPQQAMKPPGKRPSGEMGGSQEFGPRFKRQSTGSSQWDSGSQSAVSSPEFSRPPSVAGWAQPIMGPPPPMGRGQPGTNIEHHPFRHEQSRRGSTSSAASHAGSRMANLTFQSPSEGSPEGRGPPRAGLLWGGPEGVERRVFEHLGGGYEAQAPFHGQQGQAFAPQILGHRYQGPVQVQQTPAYGQLTEAYGYMVPVTDFQGPRQREPQVGIPHTQQFAPRGGWNPQHPAQQQAPLLPAPEQHPYQRGRAKFAETQRGSGYAGDWGRNVSGFGASNVQGGGGYPPGFPPAQPATHGGHFALPQQPQHMAAIPQGRGNDPSGQQTALAAQYGQGNTFPSFRSGTQPMHHRQYLPPPPPSAMRNIDQAQFQAPALPPVGHNYPSSLPPATRPMPAQLVHSPEYEDVPVYYSESE